MSHMQIYTLKYSYCRIRFKKQDLSICCLLGVYITHKNESGLNVKDRSKMMLALIKRKLE